MAACAGPAPGADLERRISGRWTAVQVAPTPSAGRPGLYASGTPTRVLDIAVLVNGLRDRRISVVQWASKPSAIEVFGKERSGAQADSDPVPREGSGGREDDMRETIGAEGVAEPQRPDVGALLESLRRVDARIGRRRRGTSLRETDRAAMRFLLENGRTADVTTTMIVAALQLAAPSGTALVDRLQARGLVMVASSPVDRRKKIIRPVDHTLDPDDLDPLTTTLRAVAARLTVSDAHVVAGFLREVLATMTRADLTTSARVFE